MSSIFSKLDSYIQIYEDEHNRKYNYIDDCFSQQREVIEWEQSGDYTLCCTRRAGKTETIPRKFVKACSTGVGHNCAYITQTRDIGKDILWDVTKRIIEKSQINVHIDNSTLQILFKDTGSTLFFKSINDDESINKLRGYHFKHIVVDEAQNIPDIRLRKFSQRVARMCLSQHRGSLGFAGTPHEFENSYFYEMCHHPQVKHFGWSWKDNPFFLEQIRRADPKLVTIQDIERAIIDDYKLPIDDPIIQREVFGRWVRSTNLLVYKFDPKLNTCIIPEPRNHWQYVIGIDLGFEDHNAISVLAHDCYTGMTYLVDEFKRNHMSVSELAPEIIKRQEKFNPIACVMDTSGLSKMVQDEYNKRVDFKIGILSANRANKFDSIGFLNDDFLHQKIWFPENSLTGEEMLRLVYDDKAFSMGKYLEKPGLSNHLCDATKYAWDWLNTFIRKDPPRKRDRWSEEWMKLDEDKQSGDIESYDSMW